MTPMLAVLPVLDLVAIGAALVTGVVLGGLAVAGIVRRRRADRGGGVRILLPLAGAELSCAAVDAAARLALAERATVVPVALVTTPYQLSLERPLPDAAEVALRLLDAAETRLHRAGVPVDPRLVQGRTIRHAIRRLVEQEAFDRFVVPAGAADHGLAPDDVAWILATVPGEILVLRPPGRRAVEAGGPRRCVPDRRTGPPRARVGAAVAR